MKETTKLKLEQRIRGQYLKSTIIFEMMLISFITGIGFLVMGDYTTGMLLTITFCIMGYWSDVSSREYILNYAILKGEIKRL